jgi:hypothetical protein
MRTLGAGVDSLFRIKEVPTRENPTPKPTDEKSNKKHWVKKRIEVSLSCISPSHYWSRFLIARPYSPPQKQRMLSSSSLTLEPPSSPRQVNQSPVDDSNTSVKEALMAGSGGIPDDILSPSRISSVLPGMMHPLLPLPLDYGNHIVSVP